MPKVPAIAWREFKHTALTKGFIFGAVVLPLLMWSAFPLIAMLTKRAVEPMEGRFVIIDATSEIADAARIEFDPQRLTPADRVLRAAGMGAAFDVEIEVVNDAADLERYKQDVARDDLLGVAIVDPAAFDIPVGETTTIEEIALSAATGELDAEQAARSAQADAENEAQITLYVPSGIKSDHSRILRRRLAASVVRARAARAGSDIETLQAITREPDVDTVAITEEGVERAESIGVKELLPFGFMMLLWASAFTSGNYLLTTTIEEKSNKVIEVLLSAVSPMQLMTGKILGQGLVAVVMLIMYGGLGIAAVITLASIDLIPPILLVYLAAYFIMAYFFIASIMASVGSAVNDLHEAQSLLTPAMLVLFAPMLLMLPASQDPNGAIATISSFIPPLTPFIMIVRVSAGEVPLWQVIATMAIGAAAVVASLWTCSKIFRIGVLMQGKPPSPLQMLRWLRYS